MPELPEVETVVRDLRPLLVGRSFGAIAAGRQKLRRPWSAAWAGDVTGQAVEAIRRRGKWIVVSLASDKQLLFHLGMTGQLTVTPVATPVADHTHLVFALIGTSDQLRFRDIRRFGGVTLFDSAASVDGFLAETLGPEPFDLSGAAFAASVRATGRCLKAVLLDQHVVAGVGNIYADESLHLARLHPARRGTGVTPAECGRLRIAVVEVLTLAIESRGSTIRDYVGGSGLRGGYQERFRVYGRTGEPCPTCGAAVECSRLAGRSSHYCPACQPAPSGS